MRHLAANRRRGPRQLRFGSRVDAGIGRFVAALAIAALPMADPAGCAEAAAGSAATGSANAEALRGGVWVAEDIGGRGVLDRAQSTVGFDDAGRVAGSGGCNHYNGPVTIAGASLTFGSLATTMRACPPAMMEQEQRFFVALSATSAWQIDGAFLFFDDAKGQPLIKFIRLPG